jgi:hypothetical protein
MEDPTLFLWGPSDDELIAMQAGAYQAGTGVEYALNDQLGNVHDLIDVHGTVMARFNYNPFGKQILAVDGSPVRSSRGAACSEPNGCRQHRKSFCVMELLPRTALRPSPAIPARPHRRNDSRNRSAPTHFPPA